MLRHGNSMTSKLLYFADVLISFLLFHFFDFCNALVTRLSCKRLYFMNLRTYL